MNHILNLVGKNEFIKKSFQTGKIRKIKHGDNNHHYYTVLCVYF